MNINILAASDWWQEFLKRGQYFDPNAPAKPGLIDMSKWNIFEKLQNTLDQILIPLKAIGEFFSYLLHPSKIFIALWNWTVEISFVLCLFVCLASVLMYIFGYKKYAKFAPLSIFIYTFIQALGSAFK